MGDLDTSRPVDQGLLRRTASLFVIYGELEVLAGIGERPIEETSSFPSFGDYSREQRRHPKV